MDDALILETTALIDLERERHRQADGPMHRFLRVHTSMRLFITDVIAGELASGLSLAQRARWEAFLQPFRVLPVSRDVDWEYGVSYRYLRANGLLIGANDLWIAATAIAYGIPLVTRNGGHFRRVPGLQVMGYGAEAGVH